jgi:hypothetical protein
MQVLIDYGGAEPRQNRKSTLPTWLMTNKAVYKEGLGQLLIISKLSWQDTLLNGYRAAQRTESPWFKIPSTKDFHIKFHFDHIHGSDPASKTLELQGYGYDRYQGPYTLGLVCTLLSLRKYGVEKQIRQVAKQLDPAHKTLHLTCVINLASRLRFDPNSAWKVVLPDIQVQFKDLKELHVRLKMTEHHGYQLSLSRDIMPVFEAEVIKFGQRLGIQGTLTTHVRRDLNIRAMYHVTVFDVVIKASKT